MENNKFTSQKEPVLINGNISVDDRGSVTFCNDFNFEGVKRAYMVENHNKGFIRAFHYHDFEGKYVSVVNGTILLYTVKVNKEDLDKSEVKKFILSSKKPQILFIPKSYANGFKTLTDDTKIIFYSTSTLEESLGDDIRYPYNQWGNNWEEDYR